MTTADTLPRMGADEPQGPGWWIASDAKWYPPELHPDRPMQRANPPSVSHPPPPREPTNGPPREPALPPEPAPRRPRRWVAPGLAVALVASLAVNIAIAGVALYGRLSRPSLSDAVKKRFAIIRDVGWDATHESLTMNFDDTDSIASFSALELLLDDLGFSSAVYDRMSLTRALDGMQTARGDQVTVLWTYHPDDGLNVVFERD